MADTWNEKPTKRITGGFYAALGVAAVAAFKAVAAQQGERNKESAIPTPSGPGPFREVDGSYGRLRGDSRTLAALTALANRGHDAVDAAVFFHGENLCFR
ncbi:hypothetical protein [Rhizobium leguminosarum]|uniref:Uncharacterized protein n=1 Tax=Rhizobium leguminosarum TaxID=384 RepID=A0A2Z4YTC9_RHILE|nr:hypothetical protein [Rhizobium leguminosarum]AXA44620.1 hypothetical protein DLJ82_6649 [Rhizobium leguminosarum]